MQHSRLLGILTLTVVLGGCTIYDRMDNVERDLAHVKQSDQTLTVAVDDLWLRQSRIEGQVHALVAELRGVSTTQVAIPPDDRPVVIFGNGSGYKAAVTLTTISVIGSGALTVLTRRIARPSDRVVTPENSTGNPTTLPPNFERSEPLDITAVGARRQIVVPCGYELAARGNGVMGRVGVVIKYGEACVQ